MTTTLQRGPNRGSVSAYAQRSGAALRRRAHRIRRVVQRAGETIADRARPASVDTRDVGRLAAAMTVSGAFMALLFVSLSLLVVTLYTPLARDALRAMGFDL